MSKITVEDEAAYATMRGKEAWRRVWPEILLTLIAPVTLCITIVLRDIALLWVVLGIVVAQSGWLITTMYWYEVAHAGWTRALEGWRTANEGRAAALREWYDATITQKGKEY